MHCISYSAEPSSLPLQFFYFVSFGANLAFDRDLPSRGATSWLQSFAAITVMSAMEGSLFAGCKASDYLSEDTTRLFPAAAFEEAGADLLRMAGEGMSLY